MKRRWLILLQIVVLAGCFSWNCPAQMADQPAANPAPTPRSVPPKQPYFLTGKETFWRALPPKPALGSTSDHLDLVITLSIQASRTEDQKNEALHDKDYSIKLVTEAIDPDFETKYPNTFQVLSHADIDSYYFTSKLKQLNGRLRPFAQHPNLVVPLFTASEFTYPSGHSSGSELQARILATLFPSHREDVLKRARQIADSRIVAGVHYTSDTEAGRALGDMLFTALEAKPKFRNELAEAAAKDQIPK